MTERLQAAQQDSTYFNPNSYSLFPYRAVGRVYFIEAGQAYACSASVIGEYAVWTAGHCVHPGDGDPSAWHTNWIFIPAYKDGARPYGVWQAAYLYTTNQWMNIPTCTTTTGGDRRAAQRSQHPPDGGRAGLRLEPAARTAPHRHGLSG